MKRANILVEEMKSIGSLDVITYNTLLKGYCVSRDLPKAKALLKEMPAVGVKPNDVSYNCLVNAAVSNGNFPEACEIVDQMEASGVPPDHFTISIMMKALKHAKNPKYVAATFALLDRAKVRVCSDEILLNTVLETCTRNREFRRLTDIMGQYDNSGIRPAVHTYGSLIKAASNLGDLDRCWRYWKDMTEHRRMLPNNIVLGCMLDALVCNSRIDDAVELLEQWKDRVPPNTVMYSTIIKGFANSHQAGRAMAMWRQMRTEGVKMNIVAYNSAIDAQARVGAIDNVSELFEAMSKDELSPDVITYSTIVKGYCINGDLDRAFEVYKTMMKNDMVKEAIIYNTLLDGCHRQNRMDLAARVLGDLEANNIVPSNCTLGIMVKMYGRRGDLDKAFEAVETLPKKHGFVPNSQVLTCLMCACLQANETKRARLIFEQLKDSKFGADSKAHGALISGLVRSGELAQAVEVVEVAVSKEVLQGEQLEQRVLQQLVDALARRSEAEARPLLARLTAAKVSVTASVRGDAGYSNYSGGNSQTTHGQGKGGTWNGYNSKGSNKGSSKGSWR